MSITLDYSEAAEGNVEDGTYEALILSAKFDENNNGKQFINIDTVIRNDVKQKYQNSHVFTRIWPKKNTTEYSMPYLFAIGMNAGIPDKTQYNGIPELLRDFVGKPVKITVKNETSEYNGKTYENLNIKKWTKTRFPNVQHKLKETPSLASAESTSSSPSADPFANNSAPLDVSDDDLPF